MYQHLRDWLLNSCNRASGHKAGASSLYSQPATITVRCASLEPQPKGTEVWFFWTRAWSNQRTAPALRNKVPSNKHTEIVSLELRLYLRHCGKQPQDTEAKSGFEMKNGAISFD